jgi:hypothetical protein
MHLRCVAAIAVLGLQLAGCASVVDGTTQSIYVSTEPVSGANCQLSNTRGAWSVTTPGDVHVARSDSVLEASCTKDGWRDAREYFASKLPIAAMVGGMLPYVGPLSLAVDGSSGAGGQYPNTITIGMKPAKANIAATPTSAAAAPQK